MQIQEPCNPLRYVAMLCNLPPCILILNFPLSDVLLFSEPITPFLTWLSRQCPALEADLTVICITHCIVQGESGMLQASQSAPAAAPPRMCNVFL